MFLESGPQAPFDMTFNQFRTTNSWEFTETYEFSLFKLWEFSGKGIAFHVLGLHNNKMVRLDLSGKTKIELIPLILMKLLNIQIVVLTWDTLYIYYK